MLLLMLLWTDPGAPSWGAPSFEHTPGDSLMQGDPSSAAKSAIQTSLGAPSSGPLLPKRWETKETAVVKEAKV